MSDTRNAFVGCLKTTCLHTDPLIYSPTFRNILSLQILVSFDHLVAIPFFLIFNHIGPKLYISQADTAQSGTTFLHLDKSGAVNIMLYASLDNDPSKFGARWHIWPASSISALSRVIDPEATDEACRLAHPIIAETHYVDPTTLPDGESPWEIYQQPGEVVIIPPACPHQVTSGFNPHCKMLG